MYVGRYFFQSGRNLFVMYLSENINHHMVILWIFIGLPSHFLEPAIAQEKSVCNYEPSCGAGN